MTSASIKIRVLLLALLPMLAVAVALSVFFTVSQINALTESLEERGQALARNIAPACEYGLLSGNDSMLQGITAAALREPEVTAAAILDADGTPVASSGKTHHNDYRNIAATVKTRHSGTVKDEIIVFHSPIMPATVAIEDFVLQESLGYSAPAGGQDASPLGWVVIELSIRSTQEKKTAVLLKALLTTVSLLFVSAIIALRVGRNITNPILNLAQAVQKLKQGRLETRVRSEAGGEIQMLESGVNSMAESLQTAHEKLKAAVETATRELHQTLHRLEQQNEELAAARQQALSLSEAKSTFLTNMSHELRTPMNGVLGFTRLLLRTDLTADQREYLQLIARSGEGLLEIINDILEFSQIEAHKAAVRAQTFNLRDCIEDSVLLLSPAAQEKDLSLACMIYSDVPAGIHCDAQKLQRIFTNLIGNAVKFTMHGSVEVRIMMEHEISPDEILLKVTVRDTGIGIAPDKQPHLFEPFVQADSQIHRVYGGSGLGLAISRSLIQMLGGEIGLDSELNVGTTVWFTFRCKPVAVPSGPAPRLAGRRAWLYDGTAFSHLALQHTLNDWGMNVLPCRDLSSWPSKMAEAPSTGQQDLVVLSLTRGEFEHLPPDRIADAKRQFDCRILMLLNSSDPQLIQSAAAFGADCVLLRPTRRRDLYDAVLSLLGMAVNKTDSSSISAPTRSPPLALRALIAEDNEVNSKLLCTLLEKQGVTAVAASDGQRAVEEFRNQKFDIVFMDIHMPVLDGEQAAREIRSHEGGQRHTPIIALTADVLANENSALTRADIDTVLMKPLAERQLLQVLHDWCGASGVPAGNTGTAAQPDIDNSAIIDWPRCVDLANGNAALARELLQLLAKDLRQRIPLLSAGLQHEQYGMLREQAHKIRGAAACCATPRLLATAAVVEAAAKDCCQAGVASGVTALLDEISRVVSGVEAFQIAGMPPAEMR